MLSILFHRFALILLIANIAMGQQNSGYTYTSYQKGIICNSAQTPFRPKKLEDIQAIITMALLSNYTVKAVGNLHSATDIICTDGIPISMERINHFQFDHNTGLATVGAGSTLQYFLESLHKFGRTVHGIPTYGDITIGGAIGTGAHGTSYKTPASISDQFVGVVVVDGLGNLRNITDRETLRAFRTHLGLLGILYEVTFPTVPQYKIHARYFPQPHDILWNGDTIKRLIRTHDRFSFFWFPTSKRVVVYAANVVPLNTTGNCQTNFLPDIPATAVGLTSRAVEIMQEEMNYLGIFMLQQIANLALHRNVPLRAPMFTQYNASRQVCKSAVGYVHRMSANTCNPCPWSHGNSSIYNFESAVIIPLKQVGNAVRTMRKILKAYPVDFPLTGIIFRFLPGGDGLLSVNGGRDSVSIEWILIPRKDRFNKPMLGLPACQAMIQALMTKHQGRAHWGKNGPVFTRQSFLQKAYPHLPIFIKHMEEFDPFGIFMNDFGRKLKLGETKSSMDSYTSHCALMDGCICENDKDCGDEFPGSYFCDYLTDYRVCRERPEEYRSLRSKSVRGLLNAQWPS